ncbi:hypothetical protein CBR_g53682 [Chara braunii]|uniref:Reverse transcriptase domain-containing protein n=1 Tax=Chara braunii TaxID=69332 RepID=A0A388MBB6_CHABU|nr:hypothetical protein CBR_g53682 [Chara braunii]|eukprot:GBG91793.1 hypothetical protein CBR_g53682 [Chara braunii]
MKRRAKASRQAHDQTSQEYLRRMEALGEIPPAGGKDEWWAEWVLLHSEWASWQARDAELWGLSSKIKWVRDAECMSKAFFAQMKKTSHSPLIVAMGHPFDPLEERAENTTDILRYVELFYDNLYREDEYWPQEDVAAVPAKEVWDKCATRVTLEHMATLDAPITQEEVAGALSGMHRGKAPGPDGLPAEYLMAAMKPLLPYLCEAFNRLYSGEEAPPAAFGQATIVLLYKKGCIEEVRNWRPISLLLVPSKLYAKVLANEVAVVLPALIHSTKTGFVPRRQILVNVLLVRQIMERARNSQHPLAILILDFEKAYYRVRWQFLLQVTWATHQSVSTLRNEVTLFEKYAGARINWGKPVAVVPAGVDVAMFEGMRTQLPGDQFLYLGILVPTALSTGQRLEDLLHHAVVRMVAWAKRASHGVFGKVLIANNAVSATLWYAGAVSDPPKKAWKDYKRALRKLLWKDDPEAIKVHPADVEMTLLHPQLVHGLRRGAQWSSALEKWREAPLRQTAPRTCDQILGQSLFGNRFILRLGVPFPWQCCPGAFGKQWLSCGVTRVGDIWDVQGGTWKEEGEVFQRLDHQPKKQERLEEIKQAIPQDWIDCLVAKDRMQGEWVTLEGQGRPVIFFQLKERLGSQWYAAEAWEDVGQQKVLGDVLVRRPEPDTRLHEENIRSVVVLRDQTVSKGGGFRPFKPACRPLQFSWDPSVWEWGPRNSLMKCCRIHQVTTKVIYRSLLVPTDMVDEMREGWRKRGWLDQKALLAGMCRPGGKLAGCLPLFRIRSTQGACGSASSWVSPPICGWRIGVRTRTGLAGVAMMRWSHCPIYGWNVCRKWLFGNGGVPWGMRSPFLGPGQGVHQSWWGSSFREMSRGWLRLTLLIPFVRPFGWQCGPCEPGC